MKKIVRKIKERSLNQLKALAIVSALPFLGWMMILARDNSNIHSLYWIIGAIVLSAIFIFLVFAWFAKEVEYGEKEQLIKSLPVIGLPTEVILLATPERAAKLLNLLNVKHFAKRTEQNTVLIYSIDSSGKMIGEAEEKDARYFNQNYKIK